MFHLFHPTQHSAPDTILTDCASLLDLISDTAAALAERQLELSDSTAHGMALLTHAVASNLRDLEHVYRSQMAEHFAMGLQEGQSSASTKTVSSDEAGTPASASPRITGSPSLTEPAQDQSSAVA